MAEIPEHITSENKRVALLIAVLALLLAFSETLAKSAQTEALTRNVEAANLWAFFQAKTIRATTVRTAVEAVELDRLVRPVAQDAPTSKQLDEWHKTIARWDSEPGTGEGRKELMSRAGAAEHKSALAMARYHHFELASASFQIAIVLASAMVITGAAVLVWLSVGLGLAGLALGAIGLVAPEAVHFF